MNPTRDHEVADLLLLWLWRGLAATAPIKPLAWEPSHAVGAALEKTKKDQKKKKRKYAQHLYLTYRNYDWQFFF